MKYITLLSFFFLLNQSIYSQYQNGYLVKKDGENVIGLIKNQNWSNNPERINFKVGPNEFEQTIDITNLSEFGIGDDIKFIVSEVNLDVSSENINDLNNNKNPIFESRVLALRKLVDGKISLHEYQFAKGTRFYFKIPDQNFEPLIYKRYSKSNNQVGKNEQFKQQLSNLFGEHRDDLNKKLTQLSYSRKSISNLVAEYNLLSTNASTNYFKQRKKKTKLNFSIIGGIEQNSVSYQFANTATLNPSFSNMSRTIFGPELELLMLNERIGLFSGYTFKSKVSETVDLQTSSQGLTQKATLSFNNNSFSFGIRGYIPTVKNLNLILSLGFSTETVSEFSVDFEISDVNQDFTRNGGSEFFGFGVGYKKLFAEVRFFENKIFVENVSNSTPVDSSSFNFRLGYNIL